MNQKATSNQPVLTLDADCTIQLVEQYKDIASSIAKHAKITQSEIHVSLNALTLALAEAKTDLEIMTMRRRPSKGISLAKIAGIITFRLSRFAPINLTGNALENDVALKLNDLVALTLALKAILGIDIQAISSTHATKELQYTLARRHMNQETLGLAFELLSNNAS